MLCLTGTMKLPTATALQVPGIYQRNDEQYFKFCRAVEFALDHDDGANPSGWVHPQPSAFQCCLDLPLLRCALVVACGECGGEEPGLQGAGPVMKDPTSGATGVAGLTNVQGGATAALTGMR